VGEGAKILRFPTNARLSRLPAGDDPPAPSFSPEQVEFLLETLGAGGKKLLKRTFKQMADLWLEANQTRLVQPANERRHIEHLRILWELREGELMERIVTQALGCLVRPHGPLGPSTVNKVRSTGKRIIDDASANGDWTGPNPFRLSKRLKQVRPSHRILSVEEIGLILPFLRDDRRRLAKISLGIAARPGELLGARKEDVDLKKGVFLICRSHGRDSTKTGVSRELPIPAWLVEDFREAMAESVGPFLFSRADGTRWPPDTKLARILKTAMTRAGIVSGFRLSCRRKSCRYRREIGLEEQHAADCPKCGFRLWRQGIPQRVRFYDLRHSSVSNHHRAGMAPRAIKMMLGHSIQDVTDGYTHLTGEEMRTEMSKMDLEAKPAVGEHTGGSLGSLRSTAELPPRDLRPGVPLQPLLTVKDVAERLSISETTVYRRVEDGLIPHVRLWNMLRFRSREIDALIEEGLSKDSGEGGGGQ
jgi:excisionase family DNA binding protein